MEGGAAAAFRDTQSPSNRGRKRDGGCRKTDDGVP